MSKLDKMRQELESAFRDAMHQAFRARYGVELKTEFNIFTMELMSFRTDRQDFTEDQHAFIAGYSQAFNKAISLVLLRDADDIYQRELRANAKEAARAI